MNHPPKLASGLALSLAASLALAACNQADEREYEVGATDEGGGELIVTEPDPDAVPVELPETEMTNVPAGEGEAGTEAE
ncbi:hypothetical protein [Erythrobacter mangrovi]|uniref:Argininosuccinate lyase n=1 Tax=Erythrobacter mangrovi TaxID=2739433 RepID=A0A7D4BMZ1_9SPHN|nr:hypothetical protein [Erythrobacter mangrovi]QKG70664.1 hypothetical protein HQR01_04370 [Erythrobacter mangrovi]